MALAEQIWKARHHTLYKFKLHIYTPLVSISISPRHLYIYISTRGSPTITHAQRVQTLQKLLHWLSIDSIDKHILLL